MVSWLWHHALNEGGVYSCADTLGQAYICCRPSISPSLSSQSQFSVSVPFPQLAAVVPFLNFLISYFPFLISSFLVLSPPSKNTPCTRSYADTVQLRTPRRPFARVYRGIRAASPRARISTDTGTTATLPPLS